MAPEYVKAAKALEGSPVKLAKVDATANTGLAKKFDIKGFPTLKFFKNGKPSEYNGGRTEGDIVTWLNKKTGPVAVTLNSEEELLKFQESHDVFVLGVFESADSASAKTFLAAANADETSIYAVATDLSIKTKLGVSVDTIVVLKSFDDLRADLVFASSTTSDEIVEFASANSTPLIQEFSQETAKKIFGSKIQRHVLFFTNKDAAHHEGTVAAYREVASQFKGKLLFINVPTTEDKVMGFFDLTADKAPATILADLGAPSGLKKFPFTGEHTSESISAFVTEFLDGKLKPFLKSEEATPADTTGDVVVLRGSTFADIVLNNNKDVLVEFYAPWCGHCKKLSPIWDELGSKLSAQRDQVVVAKIDATANEIDVPGVAVRGFPTIYFFKGDDKANPVKYEGGRTLDDFLQYLESNAHHSVSRDEL